MLNSIGAQLLIQINRGSVLSQLDTENIYSILALISLGFPPLSPQVTDIVDLLEPLRAFDDSIGSGASIQPPALFDTSSVALPASLPREAEDTACEVGGHLKTYEAVKEEGGNKILKRVVDIEAKKAKRKEYRAWYRRMKTNEAAADPEKRDERRLKRKQIDKRYRMNKKFKERAAAEESETGFF
jgi:hypothetical protein